MPASPPRCNFATIGIASVYTRVRCRAKEVGESPLFYWTRPFLRKKMADRGAVVGKVEEIAERVGARAGIEIAGVELLGGGANRVLRIFIDKPEGVSHADCEFISQNVGTILDVEDVMPGARYTLEVSSPGLERRISKPRDFERFTGKKVKVTLRQPIDNQRHFTGALTQFKEGIITLEPSPGRSVQFPLDQVERANLKFEW
jgi:ribosome maturation factor RimP